METVTIPLSDLNLDPANVREHPSRNVDAIRASLAAFGQQKPIVVDPSNVVVAGNGTVEAARQLNWVNIEAVKTDLEGAQRVAFAIADNRTSELGRWSSDLGSALAGLKSDGGIDEILTGFSPNEIEALILGVQPPDDFPSIDENIETEYGCPKCGYEWSGKPKPNKNDEAAL
tara:strand:- start:1581 stop:2099 length:519 start_codon:yes stop_codon:yes gene_type:complete